MDYLLELRLKPCSHAKCFPGQEMTPSVVIKIDISRLDHHMTKGKGELCLWLTDVCGTCDLVASHNR